MVDLPDINIWVALTLPKHPHHLIAMRYWREQASNRLAFNAITRLGFLRVVANLARLNGEPKPISFASDLFVNWILDPSVSYVAEPAGVWKQFDECLQRGLVTERNGTDIYLASFAATGGHRLISFDKDYAALDFVSVLNPLEDEG